MRESKGGSTDRGRGGRGREERKREREREKEKMICAAAAAVLLLLLRFSCALCCADGLRLLATLARSLTHSLTSLHSSLRLPVLAAAAPRLLLLPACLAPSQPATACLANCWLAFMEQSTQTTNAATTTTTPQCPSPLRARPPRLPACCACACLPAVPACDVKSGC